MLTLRLKSGEYIAIGDDIAIQVFRKDSEQIEVAVQAPREIPIVRANILERTGNRPDGLRSEDYTRPAVKAHNAKRKQALDQKLANRQAAINCISTTLTEIERTNSELQAKIAAMRSQLLQIR